MLAAVALNPGPPGALCAVRVVDTGTGEPVNLDVDDLELVATITGGTATASVDPGDEVTILVAGETGAPVGLVTLAITSDILGADLTVDVLVDIPSHAYEATVAGVEAFVSNLTITYRTTPSTGDVGRFIDDAANLVATHIGILDELASLVPPVVDLYTTRARAIVHLLAAAYTEDAAHPERIAKQDDNRYAAVLERRAMLQLTALEADVSASRQDAGVDPTGVPSRRAGASFPPPQWRRDTEL